MCKKVPDKMFLKWEPDDQDGIWLATEQPLIGSVMFVPFSADKERRLELLILISDLLMSEDRTQQNLGAEIRRLTIEPERVRTAANEK